MKFNWKLFVILLIASIIGSIAIIPYSLTLQGVPQNLPVPLYVLLIAGIIQSAILYAVLIFVGLYLAKKVSLGLPIVEGWLEGKEVKSYLKSILGISIGLGIIAGILVIALSILFEGGLQVGGDQVTRFSWVWQGFLASFYGGINEEIMMRLFLMSLFAWIFFIIRKRDVGKPTNTMMRLAIVLSAVIFGIGHLPTLFAITTPTLFMVAQVIILNSVAGIIFGWLYWKKGLESAMMAHFSADIVLHVIFPAVIISIA